MCIGILTQERQAQSEWKGVEEPQKTTTRQTNYDWYHGHGKGISRPINDTKNNNIKNVFVTYLPYVRRRE